MKLLSIKYFFIAFLFFCFACNGKSDISKTQDNHESGDNHDTVVDGVKSLNDVLPRAVFTDPRLIAQGKHSKAIIGYLESLINATPEDAAIYISIYLFNTNESGLVNAIRDADDRGVHVHIILDRSNSDYNDAIYAKLSAMSKTIDIVSLYNNIKSYAINHNKFALFSKLVTKNGKVKKVVFTSSENFTTGTEKLIQNAVILSNKGLYDAYLNYWQEMKRLADHKMKSYDFIKYDDLKNGIMAFFYPKRKNGSYYGPDPIVSILDKIQDPAEDTIQIAMAFWRNDRSNLIDKLQQLMNKGATVEIVVRSGQPAENALKNLADNGAFVNMFNYSKVPDVKKIGLHSKEMLIRGKWNGHKTNVIITGSENYNYGGLRTSNNNNVLLSSYHFKHPDIFKAYEDNFNEIKVLPGVCCKTVH